MKSIRLICMLVFLPFCGNSQSTQVDSTNCRCNPQKLDTLQEASLNYEIIETKPEFPGGIKKFLKFLNGKKITDKSKNGKIQIQFVINCDGVLCDFKYTNIEGNIKEEDIVKVINYLETMPNWQPARINGVLTDSNYILPIKIQKGKIRY